MSMHRETYTRAIAMILAMLLIATAVPLQTAKATNIGNGAGAINPGSSITSVEKTRNRGKRMV